MIEFYANIMHNYHYYVKTPVKNLKHVSCQMSLSQITSRENSRIRNSVTALKGHCNPAAAHTPFVVKHSAASTLLFSETGEIRRLEPTGGVGSERPN